MTDLKLDRLGRDLGERLEVQDTGLAPRAPALRKFAGDPVAFSLAAGRAPTDYQQEVMRAVAAERYVAWKSGHGVGKDWSLGDLAVWGAYCRAMLVLVVSATERQVVGQTLREVKAAWRAHRDAGRALRGEWYAKSLRIGDEDRVIAVTGGASVDALTGWHDSNGVLVLVSESQAEALEDSVYDALDTVTTNAESRVVVVGNPVRPYGPFHAVHQRPTWRRFTTSVHDTPNVKAGRMVNPAFPAPDWPATAAREHGGPESAWSLARIYGEFPDSVEGGLTTPADLDRAADPERGARSVEALVRLPPPNEQRGYRDELGRLVPERPSTATVAVDPAGRGADQTALATVARVILDGRAAWLVLELLRWREPDATRNAERVAEHVRRLVAEQRLMVERVVVDESGLGAVLSPLKRMIPEQVGWSSVCETPLGTDWTTHHPRVEAFNSAWRAPSPSRFVDTRAQSYVHVAELLARGELAFAPGLDPKLVSDLRAELLAHQSREETDGRVRVLAKDEVRRQLGRSPDLADALAMAFLGELARERPEKAPHRRFNVRILSGPPVA